MPLQHFHNAVSSWFQQAFRAPTPVQEKAWRSIRSGRHTLIAAPTGSGKTLAAFLAAIDDLVKQSLAGTLPAATQVLYISPLKALSNDIERNLQVPLASITRELEKAGLPAPAIKVMVRTGDTPAADRASMIKNPPHILVTTPESFYLLLTGTHGRSMLGTVHTLIIDEIHALVGDKRGSHLCLSVERLEALVSKPLHRIGLSATQKPVEEVARFLTGASHACDIIDTGHSRRLDLSLMLPDSPLTAVMSNEVWTELYRKLVELIQTHDTTLIFVNTRRLAERLSHALAEWLGAGQVLAHHGSMSKEHRLDAEQKLKTGKLKAMVATASMELGIDVGSIELVCQIASPHSIAAFLQRVGRSGHSVDKTPKGILFPLTRDELVECVALLDAIRKGELDRLIMPEQPLDILAQQIVAETSCSDYAEDDLFALVTRAYPYRNMSRKTFDEVIAMLSEGFASGRGRRGAYLHHDGVHHAVKARKGAKLTAIMSGGAIADNFDYDVMLEPGNVFIGTLNEDFAVESLPGDIFKLGNNAWKILRIERGKVRVEDAAGQPPNIPFWLGEAPARSNELSFAVSRLRDEIAVKMDALQLLSADANANEYTQIRQELVTWLQTEKNLDEVVADQVVTYLATAKAALGVLPTQDTLVMERFFDDAGDMHLVIHAPFGARLNKAWGLALRKRFCRKFNFELQAAANDDAIVLSLGSTHSFPLEEVFDYLSPDTVREVLIQALLDAPVFGVRWRWNASRALAVIRRRANQKVPAQLQRMQSDDLVAQVFPDQLACLENIPGDRDVPDHPLVNQTIHDCLHEAMDLDGLIALLTKIKDREIRLVARELTEPSPLAHEIISARPYAFLDDAPLEERRTQAIRSRRWLSPEEAKEIGHLDPAAIEAVKVEAWPEATTPDELHDALMLSGFFSEAEGRSNGWSNMMQQLMQAGRATALSIDKDKTIWVATERLPAIVAVYPKLRLRADDVIPAIWLKNHAAPPEPLKELVRSRLEIMGPVTLSMLAAMMALPEGEINVSLHQLESEGFVFRGRFTETEGEAWCERRLLARISRYTIRKLRSEIQPVAAADYMRFLFSWHGVSAGSQGEGADALLRVLEKLEGFEAQAAAWESDILPARMADYDHRWLDLLCTSGKLVWGRFRGGMDVMKHNAAAASPVKTTAIAFIDRTHVGCWQHAEEKNNPVDNALSFRAEALLKVIRRQGASFFNDLVAASGFFPSAVEEALGELIHAGQVTSDSFTGLRALLVPDKYRMEGRSHKADVFSMDYAGRWSLLACRAGSEKTADTEDIMVIAWALLRRYGVVFRRVVERERLTPPWRDLVRVFRTMEARGQIRGGRFVEGVWGEQFALAEAITGLRNIRKTSPAFELVAVSAADPLNLTGIITPGKRVPAFYGNRILYRDGHPIAFTEAREVKFLISPDAEKKWSLQQALVQRRISPRLRKYLGKGIY